MKILEKFKDKSFIVILALQCLALMVLFFVCNGSLQSQSPVPMELDFVGEYRIGDGEWMPLSKDSRFSACEGDLWLKGNFTVDLNEEILLNVYTDHIGMEIFLEGELIHCSAVMELRDVGSTILKSVCGECWHVIRIPSEVQNGEMMIHLCNLHTFGNERAYNEFLDSFCIANSYFSDYIDKIEFPDKVCGMAVMIISCVFLGIAFLISFVQDKSSNLLIYAGFFCLFSGAFILLDTKDVSIWSELIVFNTYAKQYCMMFSALTLEMCGLEILSGKRKTICSKVVWLSVILDALWIILGQIPELLFFDMLKYWFATQLLVMPAVTIGLILEWKSASNNEKNKIIIAGVMLVTGLLEVANHYLFLWEEAYCVKWVFVILFVVSLLYALRIIPANYNATKRAKELESELKNSRITLALSQIRTHFIFNVLNAISGMCKYNPQKADDTVVRFARYLRHNIDILEEDKPVPFRVALEHLEDYIALEQVRFGEKIKFRKYIEAENFMLPPLIIQPIIENAIKHGLLPKEEGGTILLCTYQDDMNIVITISDDGVGYDSNEASRDGAVGMNNVRFRLKHMVHGNLEVNSKPNMGTVTKITIPYMEDKDACNLRG